MCFGYLPRHTMHDHSPLPLCGIVLSWNVWPHPLFISISFNTQLKYHLIYDAFPGQIIYGSFCTPFHPCDLSVTKTYFILPYSIDNCLFPYVLFIT